MSISPEDMSAYKQEFQESSELFGKALQGYQHSDEAHQKQAFKDVMDRTMGIMDELAETVGKKQQEEQLHNDYIEFSQTQSQQNYAKLSQDLAKLQE